MVEQLYTEIKQLIIDTLNLEDISADDIDTNAPIFGAGLGLDSIDALELGLAIKKKYNIVIDADDSKIRDYFASVAKLAEFISSKRVKNA